MLYIQITTSSGSQRKFKMSCLRCNCCAARKMWFQLFFFFPKHQFGPVDGYGQPRCACPRGWWHQQLSKVQTGLAQPGSSHFCGKNTTQLTASPRRWGVGGSRAAQLGGQRLSPVCRAAFWGSKAEPVPAPALGWCKHDASCQTGASAMSSSSCRCR